MMRAIVQIYDGTSETIENVATKHRTIDGTLVLKLSDGTERTFARSSKVFMTDDARGARHVQIETKSGKLVLVNNVTFFERDTLTGKCSVHANGEDYDIVDDADVTVIGDIDKFIADEKAESKAIISSFASPAGTVGAQGSSSKTFEQHVAVAKQEYKEFVQNPQLHCTFESYLTQYLEDAKVEATDAQIKRAARSIAEAKQKTPEGQKLKAGVQAARNEYKQHFTGAGKYVMGLVESNFVEQFLEDAKIDYTNNELAALAPDLFKEDIPTPAAEESPAALPDNGAVVIFPKTPSRR